MNNFHLIAYIIIIFGLINLIRMTIFLVGANLYEIKKKKKYNNGIDLSFPRYSVVIPAHNEEGTILRCVKSVQESNYKKDHIQVIVVDDGSTDNTGDLVKEYIKSSKSNNITLVEQENQGKANALNNGIVNYAKGELIMCLDSDSYIDKNALLHAAKYFQNKHVCAVGSNVKIIKRNGFLNLLQRFEYLTCFQMKRAQTLFNIEYIIGGVGSIFRSTELERVGFYDGDTVTEDIDLTLKIIKNGNKNKIVMYGSDVIAYTEAVLDIKGLIKQRFRWKWGRCQTFLKNMDMFFNSDTNFSKGFSFFYLPFALIGDVIFLFEPVLILYIFFVMIYYNDPFTILSAILVISIYIIMNIISEETVSLKDKIILTIVAPAMYFYLYILSFAEYVALIKALIKIKTLKKSIEDKNCGWQHVIRPAY